jgi:hypothetical protein
MMEPISVCMSHKSYKTRMLKLEHTGKINQRMPKQIQIHTIFMDSNSQHSKTYQFSSNFSTIEVQLLSQSHEHFL